MEKFKNLDSPPAFQKLKEMQRYQTAATTAFQALNNMNALQKIAIPSAFQKLTASSAFQQLEDMRSSLDKVGSSVFDSLNKMQLKYQSILEPLSHVAKTMQDLGSHFEKTLEQGPLKNIREMNQRLAYLNDINRLPVFQAFERIKNINTISSLNALSQSFMGQTLLNLEETFEDFDENNIEDFFGNIETAVKEQCSSLSPKNISYQGWMQIILFLISLFYAKYISYQSEINIKDSIKQTETTIEKRVLEAEKNILESIKELIPKEDNEVYYVVSRSVNLRVKPSTYKSKIITTLFPNQKVTLIKRKNKWIYVEYFDYIEGIPKTGWAYKKYLKKIN